MRKVKLIAGFLLLLGIFCFCDYGFCAKIGEQDVIFRLSETFFSRYIIRARDYSPNDDPVSMTSFDTIFPKLVLDTDVCLNLYHAVHLRKGHVDDEEIHYAGSVSRNFLDTFNVSLGHIYFDFPKAGQNDDCNETWGSFTWLKLPLLPIPVSATLFAAYDFEAAADWVFENGWFYSWGFNTALPLPDDSIFQKEQKLNLGITNWGTDGVLGHRPTKLYATEFSVSTTYCFGSFGISPCFYYSLNHEESINSDDDELWGAITVCYTF